MDHNVSPSSTRCDADQNNDHDHDNDHDNDHDEIDPVEEMDPYDHLPEEDEPTHCSICKTYRQGPCRPYWRKVEACTKDNQLKKETSKETTDKNDKNQGKSSDGDDDDDNNNNIDKVDSHAQESSSDPPCMKYILPWIDCASGFRNLYNLIELDTNYTLGIADLEAEASLSLCYTKDQTPTIDWTEWQTYVQDHQDWKPPTKAKAKATNTTTKKTKGKKNSSTSSSSSSSSSSLEPKKPLWQTLDTTKDPTLVTVTAAIPSLELDGKGLLECAYALDQDGHVIGFAYGQRLHPSEGASKEENDADGDAHANDGGQPSSDGLDTIRLNIRILPNHTTHVTLAASYIPPNEEEAAVTDKEEENSKSHLYKSRPFSLSKIAKQARSA